MGDSLSYLDNLLSKADVSSVSHSLESRSDEGLTLETAAFESLYDGQFTLSTQLIKLPNYLVSYTPHRYPSIIMCCYKRR